MGNQVWKTKGAGGIDTMEDVEMLLPVMEASTHTFPSKDIAYAAYVMDYIAGTDRRSNIRSFAGALATEYARRFAEWLGYVFLDRANLTNKSKVMKDLENGLGNWVEAIPVMLEGSVKMPSEFFSPEAQRFVDMSKVDALGQKIYRVVRGEWMKSSKTAAGLEDLPISYNPARRQYEIPKSSLTYKYRNQLRDLGFDFDGRVWITKTLDTRALKMLPQAEEAGPGPAPAPVPEPAVEPANPVDWFFDLWLPKNIDRFTKAFNSYGREQKVPYTFKFQVTGNDVTVLFQRNIDTIGEAVAELEARYGTKEDRDGWMTAIWCYRELSTVSGQAAIHVVDKANNLEHSHGSMMEHFPPGVRSWYPRFLDFKYTASPWQMIKNINDEDLRVMCSELMPLSQRQERLVPKQTDERTPKGLALEISSEPGKANKRKKLFELLKQYPYYANSVLDHLNDRGVGYDYFKLTPLEMKQLHLKGPEAPGAGPTSEP